MKKNKDGSFLEIPLGNGQRAYARQIPRGVTNFYILETIPERPEEIMDEIQKNKPLFSTYVTDNGIKSGKWKIIGFRPIEKEILDDMPIFFRQDMFDHTRCWIVKSDDPDYQMAVTPEQCVGIERAAVWDDETHIEDRLLDCIKGQPNIRVERSKVRLHSSLHDEWLKSQKKL